MAELQDQYLGHFLIRGRQLPGQVTLKGKDSKFEVFSDHPISLPQEKMRTIRGLPRSGEKITICDAIGADFSTTSINVALPVGLIANELVTNAFKYAFAGRPGGTITLHCLRQDPERYRVVVADDGVGLPERGQWPVPGKIGSLIVQTLHENTKTDLVVETETAAFA
ncbi:ATP-binding protein [Bradyrhizobium icense]|uniref:Histidine kinase/HSP90-like ATPase domain-containing protein n=1 Tax=Bradyrhizobium icense TaxID=1274631 RepID=A0A1B1UBT0_9BRAD|nr:ATP-binding protein [Bradyrhizobium icense]ANW00181.1 hypothetical protein LMTR13_08325 [Bradyrhizobium icense]